MKTRIVAIALVAVGLAGCGPDPASTGRSASDAGVRSVRVTLTEAGCDPATIRLPAGPATFVVSNDDAAAVTELEVVRDGTIAGEVENIAPGLDGDFSLNLVPGTYELNCPNGTTDAARGSLVVVGAAPTTGASETPSAVSAAVAHYRAYMEDRTDTLVARTHAFTTAVIAGDQERARELFAWAREPYEQIEPVAEAFGDLDPQIDARANDVPPATWTGFHRIEKALWVDRSLHGMAPMARALRTDVARLRRLVRTVKLDPAQIANGATELLGEVSKSKITGEEDRYSHTDLWDFQANVDGAEAAFTALRPLLVERDPTLAREIATRFAAVDHALEPYRREQGFVSYQDLDREDTRALSQAIDALAEPLSQVAGTVVGA